MKNIIISQVQVIILIVRIKVWIRLMEWSIDGKKETIQGMNFRDLVSPDANTRAEFMSDYERHIKTILKARGRMSELEGHLTDLRNL